MLQTSQNQLRMRKEEFSSKVVWFLCFQKGGLGWHMAEKEALPSHHTRSPSRPHTIPAHMTWDSGMQLDGSASTYPLPHLGFGLSEDMGRNLMKSAP